VTLTDNKLTPSAGMHLQRISDGSVAEGEIYIPPALVDDFREITHREYLEIIGQADTNVDTDMDNDIVNRVNKLEEQNKNMADEITGLQEAICEVYESII
jgi:hypothetical protein